MLFLIILIIILVILFSIDFYRKGLRQKEREFLAQVESENIEELVLEKTDIDTNIVEDAKEKEQEDSKSLLNEGFIVIYYESHSPIKIKDLNAFLSINSVRMLNSIYQKQISRKVIFSILPNTDSQVFESAISGEESKFVAVMNFRKVVSQGFDAKSNYEDMMNLLDSLQKSFGGVLLNDKGVRITKKDRQNYLLAILND